MDDAVRLFRSTREWMTPVMTESSFLEKGMLTPDEFVRAGDHLVRTCPSWKWEVGEPSKLRPYLPANKQFLVTRGVPSYSRASVIQAAKLVEETIKGEINENDIGWCSPALVDSALDPDDDGLLVDASDFSKESVGKGPATEEPTTTQKATSQSSSTVPVGDEDEYADMEDESLALDDAATGVVTSTGTGDSEIGAAVAGGAGQKATTTGASSAAVPGSSTSNNGNIVRARRYDVSVTYDNYYRTPRIWLFGFDESGSPLSPEDVFQDIIQDYAKKTVTIDPHPHIARPHASIHPCQHSVAMLGILQALKECGMVPSVEQYLFIFLKFIQSVVPTIEYDYTVEVQVRSTTDG